MRSTMRLLALAICIATTAAAMDSGSPMGVPDTFDPALGRKPVAGEWLEYHVAYQVDPLENRLSTNPIPSPTPENRDPVTGIPSNPAANPLPIWRVVPLRIEVMRAEEDGIRVVMRFENLAQELVLPHRRETPAADFYYESPQPMDKTYFHSVGAERYDVTVVRRHGQGYGFIRWSHRALPFGLARFATENLDLVLVGMGTGKAPDFPLRDIADVLPPPGQLYGTDP